MLYMPVPKCYLVNCKHCVSLLIVKLKMLCAFLQDLLTKIIYNISAC